MKKVLFVLLALCFVSSLAFAADYTGSESPVRGPDDEYTPVSMVLKGDIIDNMCADINKANLAEFVKTHTKECTLKPGCRDSGYSFFIGGRLYAFDKDSSVKVGEFLNKADSKLQVTITAKLPGDELSLVSIENQN